VGIEACPHCGELGYSEGGVVAKASAEAGATHYVAEGDPVPGDLPEGVRLVGPGAPSAEAEPGVQDAGEAEVTPEPELAAEDGSEPGPPGPTTPPGNSGASSAPDDDEDSPADYAAYPIRVLRDLCRERELPVAGAKAELVARLAAWDADQEAL